MQLNINAVIAQAPVTGSGTQNLSTDARIERLERVLQSQGLLDMLHQLQQLQQEISQLRGEIETQNYNLEQLTRRQRDLYTDVDQRMQRLERGAIPQEEVISYITDGEGPDEPPLETLSAIPDYSEASSVRSDSPLLVEIIESVVLREACPVESSLPVLLRFGNYDWEKIRLQCVRIIFFHLTCLSLAFLAFIKYLIQCSKTT